MSSEKGLSDETKRVVQVCLTSSQVRCLANENSMSSKCQRCERAGRECVYTVHSKTRRRKRTDTRVKELEEKVKNLSMLLEQGKLDGRSVPPQIDTVPEGDEVGEEEEEEISTDEEARDAPLNEPLERGPSQNFDGFKAVPESWDAGPKVTSPVTEQGSSSSARDRASGMIGSTSPDLIDRGVITLDKAQDLLDRYINVYSSWYPAVVFPTGTRASELRVTRPVL